MAATTATATRPRRKRSKPAPVQDFRAGKTPPEQMRWQLAALRRGGMPFDRAWDIAFSRIKWPHEKPERVEWRAIVEAGRHQWERAYHGESPLRGGSVTLLLSALEAGSAVMVAA
jgi:hypothetical protein